MEPLRRFYLNLGSNILPERNLADAVRLLGERGDVFEISSVWESEAVGSNGPHFLNLSVGFQAEIKESELKRTVVQPIESRLGRKRTADKNAPRSIDIDIILADGCAVNLERWSNPFVILPMAELLPEFLHPVSGKRLVDEAPGAAASIWIRRRPDITISSV